MSAQIINDQQLVNQHLKLASHSHSAANLIFNSNMFVLYKIYSISQQPLQVFTPQWIMDNIIIKSISDECVSVGIIHHLCASSRLAFDYELMITSTPQIGQVTTKQACRTLSSATNQRILICHLTPPLYIHYLKSKFYWH